MIDRAALHGYALTRAEHALVVSIGFGLILDDEGARVRVAMGVAVVPTELEVGLGHPTSGLNRTVEGRVENHRFVAIEHAIGVEVRAAPGRLTTGPGGGAPASPGLGRWLSCTAALSKSAAFPRNASVSGRSTRAAAAVARPASTAGRGATPSISPRSAVLGRCASFGARSSFTRRAAVFSAGASIEESDA
jgi:hypothetical protein